MGIGQQALAFVSACLLDRVAAAHAYLWVADATGDLRLASARGVDQRLAGPEDLPESYTRVSTRSGSGAEVAVLAVRHAVDPGRLQGLLDASRDALAAATGLDAPASDPVVAGVLDAIGDETAIIDARGTVVRCNRAWREAPMQPNQIVARSATGVDYPAALHAQQSRAARISAVGIQAVLEGTLPTFQSDYDTGDRSFSLTVAPLPTGGAVVRHVDISLRKHLQRELAHRATHDALTGLPNRLVMMDRLSQALVRAARTSSQVGLLFCDVDRFKQINDARGHLVGDHVLSVVAGRLQRSVGQSDVVARFGGDEFVVLLESVESAQAACRMARRLQEEATRPIPLDGESLRLGLTIGVATHDGRTEDQSRLISHLLAHADSAMYTAKASGRGGIHLVDAA